MATTSWTAAYAELAGAASVRVLAPYEMQHPAEYELKPGDIDAVANARLIVYAGYETMVEKLKGTAGRDEVEILQIDTRNDLATIRAGVERIAEKLSTMDEAAANLARLDEFLDGWKASIAAAGAPVLVHFFQQPLARELGFEVKGVFGPAPLEPAQIVELSQHDVRLIIDNWHNEIAAPLEETIPAAIRLSWINFPGAEGTKSLLDVLEYNQRALETALPGKEALP